MRLQLCTWPEVEARLARDPGMLVPIGSTEQHGPTGLIGTDALTADAIAIGAGRAADALVAPPINVGMALHHMAFAGTISLRPETLMAVVGETVLSLARHGCRRFLFVNGHGGNGPSVRAAFSRIQAEAADLGLDGAADLRCQIHNWWEGPTVRELAREFYGDRDGWHATASEIAVTQHLFPEAIKDADLDPEQAPFGEIHGAEDFRRRFPDGRIGSNPALATPEHGRQLLEAAIADVAELYGRMKMRA